MYFHIQNYHAKEANWQNLQAAFPMPGIVLLRERAAREEWLSHP